MPKKALVSSLNWKQVSGEIHMQTNCYKIIIAIIEVIIKSSGNIGERDCAPGRVENFPQQAALLMSLEGAGL